MTHYLFVPGGKRTKEDFDQVRALLDAQGHRTDAITLSDPEHATLSDHITELCDLIGRLGAENLHLAGHSYASFVITGAADRMAQTIERLVYLDTLIPQNGRSLLDFFADEGVDAAAFGVPSWPPFVEKLSFDSAIIDALPKTYVHCLRSQFLVMTRAAVARVQSRLKQDHWTYADIDTDHYCMINAAEEVARILTGSQIGVRR
ncbi:MAG: alpha/beta fold hydrolase [Pseudomonadota bacterium]